MKSVIYSFVAMTAIISLSTAAPASEALPVAGALCDLPGPPTASLVKDITVAQLISANPANGTLSKRATGSYQAFSGDRCDGARGQQLGINNSPGCSGAGGRHSYAVLGCNAVVTLFELDGCRGRSTTQFVSPGCYNVNTGYNWGSSTVSCQ